VEVGPKLDPDLLVTFIEEMELEILAGGNKQLVCESFGISARAYRHWLALARRGAHPYEELFKRLTMAEAQSLLGTQRLMQGGAKFLPGACWLLERTRPDLFSLSDKMRVPESDDSDKPAEFDGAIERLRERYKASIPRHLRGTADSRAAEIENKLTNEGESAVNANARAALAKLRGKT
jgi:hypothetical protein